MNRFEQAQAGFKNAEHLTVGSEITAASFSPAACVAFLKENDAKLEESEGSYYVTFTLNDMHYRIVWDERDREFVMLGLAFNLGEPQMEKTAILGIANFLNQRWKVVKTSVDFKDASANFQAELLIRSQEDFNQRFERVADILKAVADDFFNKIF